MPKQQPWHIAPEDGKIFMYKGEQRLGKGECLGGKKSGDSNEDIGPILEAKFCTQETVKFRFQKGQPRARPLSLFSWEKNEFSKRFRNSTNADEFIATWNREVMPFLDSATGKYTPGQENQRHVTSTPPVGEKRKKAPSKHPAERALETEVMLPKKKRKTDGTELDIMDTEIDNAFAGVFTVPVSCLVEPQPAHLLRQPDPAFIESLKKEMKENVMTNVSPIIGVCYLREAEEFDDNHASSYKYETIGGNNSRIALQELHKAFPDSPHYKTRMVAVYTNLADHLALRLASKHNRATGFIHSVTTQDKVNICRKQLQVMGIDDSTESKGRWRKACSAILSATVEQLDSNNLYFLASLPEEEYTQLLLIFDKFEACDLKGQKLSRSQKGTSSSKLDCKPSNFKCLRGMETSVRLALLKQVAEGELSFRELASSCQYTKKMGEVQKRFLLYHSLTTWQDAQRAFPNHTTQEALEPFANMNFAKGAMPPPFVEFCKSALGQPSQLEYVPQALSIQVPSEKGDSSCFILDDNCLETTTDGMLSLLPSAFTGFSLAFLDYTQKTCTSRRLQTFSRAVRAINAQKGCIAYSVAVICTSGVLEDVLRELRRDYQAIRVVYWQNLTAAKKDHKDGVLIDTVVPIVVAHWGSGEHLCFPSKTALQGNLISGEDCIQGTATDTCVLDTVLQLLTIPEQWVLGAGVTNGAFAVAAVQLQRNVVLASDPEIISTTIKPQLLSRTAHQESTKTDSVSP